jgi:hypothetical protein
MARRMTSSEAYRKIRQNGLLAQHHFAVYETLARGGPLTAGEVYLSLEQTHPGLIVNRNLAAARITELKNMGVVCEEDTRTCRYSGKNCIVWTTTPKLPTKLENPRRFWLVENMNGYRAYTTAAKAESYQKRAGGNVVEVVEHRKSKRLLKAA